MSKLDPVTLLLRILAAAAIVGGALAWSQPVSGDADLWWHLAAGREMCARGSVPGVDTFSCTFAGQTWINHEWVWDLVYWWLYQAHPQLTAWFNLAVIGVVFALVARVAHRVCHSLVGVAAGLWLAAATAHWFLDIRPHVFTLLFTAFFLLTRERRFAPWLWPPLVVLWANVHGGFVFGVGAIGLHVLGRWMQGFAHGGRPVFIRREWIALALCLGAWMVNPWGPQLLEYPLAYATAENPFRQTIVEWWPLGFSLDPRRFDGRFWLFAAVAALGAPVAWRRAPYLVCLSLVTFAMAVSSRRFIPLCCLTAAPLAAAALATAVGLVTSRVTVLRSRAALAVTTLLAVAVAGWFWSGVRLTPRLLERWTEAPANPTAAVRYLNALDGPTRLLNFYNWGGYVMLNAPRYRVFVDSRANTVYSDAFFCDYLDLMNGRADPARMLARHPADLALLPSGIALQQVLASPPHSWRKIYADTLAVILAPPDALLFRRPPVSADLVLADHPEKDLLLAHLLSRRGDPAAARAAVERALAADPLLSRGYRLLANIAGREGDTVGVKRAIQRGIDAYPRRATWLRAAEALILERAGDLDGAVRAARRAIPCGPFADPGPQRANLRRLEQLAASLTR